MLNKILGSVVKKRDNRPNMETLVLSPESANEELMPHLTAVSASHRHGTCNQPIRNRLINTGELICEIHPCLPLEEDHLA